MSDNSLLQVVDISCMIYGGLKKDGCYIKAPMLKTVNGFKDMNVPTGGIAYMFKLIRQSMGHCDMVFCGDRLPTIKLAMYPGYKEDRQEKRSENADRQKEIAELILKDCGLQVIARDGYEADDAEYSIAKLYKNQYDKVEVYVNDADLYICVDDNVEIMPPAENGKYVTKDNYSRTVSSKEIVPYNTVTFDKFLFGCKSDCVKELRPRALREQIYHTFYKPSNYEILGDKRRMRLFVEKYFPEALNQFDVIYPLDMDVEVLPTEWNFNRIKVWADKIGCWDFKNYNIDEVNYAIEEERIDKIIREEILCL